LDHVAAGTLELLSRLLWNHDDLLVIVGAVRVFALVMIGWLTTLLLLQLLLLLLTNHVIIVIANILLLEAFLLGQSLLLLGLIGSASIIDADLFELLQLLLLLAVAAIV